ncbi:MAG TPA: CAP domain-containing protein [Jatrophihabitantaceae bacterium]|jgi:uncharacterized protein YkwD|nr:CAP domain-containing protein [Jatrophihabitantaceae bacterium]
MKALASPLPLLRRNTAAVIAVLLVAIGTLAALRPAPAAASTVASPSIATQVLSALNYERTTHGLVALRMNTKLVAAAHAHNLAMAASNTLSHQLPGEATFTARITKAGYVWGYAGENVGCTYDMTENGALHLQSLMFHETPPNDYHRRNILGIHYVDAGIDVVLDSTNGKLWVTEDLASPN